MGYDISDYKSIYPPYGTLSDVDYLIAQLSARGMKLVMDLVVNHTSSQHPWFLESRSSLTNPKRDWYIWKKPRGFDPTTKRPMPPNNWNQILGEENSAWVWDDLTQEFYLAVFTPQQPDLNWENADVRRALHNVFRFWLDRGVAGFRMDVINLISKDQAFPDAEVVIPGQGAPQPGTKHYANGPRLHEFLDEMKREVLAQYHRIMIDRGGWNSLYLENHDQPRSVSHFTNDSDEYREYGAKLLAVLQTTLCGTLFIYQGEELGMRNVPETWGPEEYKDVESVNYWKAIRTLHPSSPSHRAQALENLHHKARDNGRTPMQWTAEPPNAGFFPPDVTPWMRVNDDFARVNAAAQTAADNTSSVYHFWQDLLKLRRENVGVFVYGAYEVVDEGHASVFAYVRTVGKEAQGGREEKWVTVLNMTGERTEWAVLEGLRKAGGGGGGVKWVVGNYFHERGGVVVSEGGLVVNEGKQEGGVIKLRPWEALLGRWVG